MESGDIFQPHGQVERCKYGKSYPYVGGQEEDDEDDDDD